LLFGILLRVIFYGKYFVFPTFFELSSVRCQIGTFTFNRFESDHLPDSPIRVHRSCTLLYSPLILDAGRTAITVLAQRYLEVFGYLTLAVF
jgi:hypothetical protein